MRFLFSIVFASLSILPALAADDYLPLGVGMVWKMKVIYSPVGGESSHGAAIQTIEEKVKRNGMTYFRARTVSQGLPIKLDNSKLFRTDEKGSYSIDERVAGAEEVKDLELPLKIGATWVRSEGGKVLTTVVIGLEDLTMEGKTYPACYHIRFTSVNGDYAEDVWDAPNIGFVKMIIVTQDGATLTLTTTEFQAARGGVGGRKREDR